jgi:hypothetical protein
LELLQRIGIAAAWVTSAVCLFILCMAAGRG